MRILADYHHADLFESLQLTLEDRFGWEVYRPIGMEWFDEWYWSFERAFHGDAVARQYLSLWDGDTDCGDHWRRVDRTHYRTWDTPDGKGYRDHRTHRMVTLEQARAMEWDIVLCSLTHNERGFARFAEEAGAVYGIQVGNVGQIDNVATEGAGWEPVRFALLSTTTGGSRISVPHVIYRQEFSLDDFRYEWPPSEERSVASFIQCFPENKQYYADFLGLAREYPEFDWKVYGASGSVAPDEFACGNLNSTPEVAEAMRRTRIAWHAKWWSDGYGHVIHNLFATGKPVIGPLGYYADKLAGPLVEVAFDIGRHTRAETIDTLRRLRDDDDYHREVSDQSAARFREIVDFDEDAEKVKALLESVV